ncbi:MAG: prepilin-type N-terminal cleavage/methylation domain-containing protein [Patescibacteria group bacterium]|nr:prepilin-type N-terminal cleavage/methylation domain-containing protein [Patescibacteria group bacterium]
MNRRKNSLKFRNKSFTLIEILIVFAIFAILAVIIILYMKPALIFAKSRDVRRVQDLKNINEALNVFAADYPAASMGNANTVYISLPDSSATCSSWTSQLPILPLGWSYNCVATSTLGKTDGTGWIPVNFANDMMIALSAFPIDPTNQPPYYYSYVTDPQWEVSAYMESSSNQGNTSIAGTDGGLSNLSYEVGSNLKLIPVAVLNRSQIKVSNDSTLVAWWPLDEGVGTVVNDYTIYGDNGQMYNGSSTCGASCYPQWTQLNSGQYVLNFNTWGYILSAPNSIFASTTVGNKITYAFWLDETGNISYGNEGFIMGYQGSGGFTPTFTDGSNWCGDWYIRRGPDVCLNASIPSNQWVFVAATYDGSVMNIYLNGLLASTYATATQMTTGFNQINIAGGSGHELSNPAGTLKGMLSNIKIYDRALSSSEIGSLYNADKANYGL